MGEGAGEDGLSPCKESLKSFFGNALEICNGDFLEWNQVAERRGSGGFGDMERVWQSTMIIYKERGSAE